METDILATLADLGHGEVVEQATQSLRAVVAAVRKTGAEGVLVLKLGVAREDSAAGTVRITCTVSAKVVTDWSPDEKLPDTTMYLDEDGNLSLDNPRQGKLATPGGATLVSLSLPDGTKTKPVTIAAMAAATETILARRRGKE